MKEKYLKIDRTKLNGFPLPNYNSDSTNIIPTSDKIGYVSPKKTISKLILPEGKTVSIAYNKGGYQLVDKEDLKSV